MQDRSGRSGALDVGDGYGGVVSRRLKRRRCAMGFGLEEFSRLVERHVNTTKNWESETHGSLPGAKDLVRLAKVLKVTVDWLLNPLEAPDPDEPTHDYSVFVVDESVLRRQLAAVSRRDPAWQLAAWFTLDQSTYALHGKAERDSVQRRVDEHVATLLA